MSGMGNIVKYNSILSEKTGNLLKIVILDYLYLQRRNVSSQLQSGDRL